MKKLIPTLLIIILVLTLANPAASQEPSPNTQLPMTKIKANQLLIPKIELSKDNWPPKTSHKKKFWGKTRAKIGFSFSVDYWMAEGDFSMVGSPPDSYNVWELKHPVDTNLYIASLVAFELKVSHVVMIDVTYGGGAMDKGRLVDTDWDGSGILRDLSYATSEGKTRYINGFLTYRLIGSTHKALKQTRQLSHNTLDISLGYHQLKNSVTYKNPLILIDNYAPSNTTWKETVNQYDLFYSGVGVRFKGEYSLNRAWSIRGLLGYIPALNAAYNGKRYPNRTPGPNPDDQQKEKIKAKGQGSEFEIKLCFYSSPNLTWWLGYKSLEFEAEGEDEARTYWAGSEEELKTNLAGWLFGLGYQF